MKTVILLRGVSGSGKSTCADVFTAMDGWVCVSADDYFTDENLNYNFCADELGAAHKQCQERYIKALCDDGVKGIVVSNTNTKHKDFVFYQNAAIKHNAKFISLVVENRHGHDSIHGVPVETKIRQAENIKNSLTLL